MYRSYFYLANVDFARTDESPNVISRMYTQSCTVDNVLQDYGDKFHVSVSFYIWNSEVEPLMVEKMAKAIGMYSFYKKKKRGVDDVVGNQAETLRIERKRC